MPIDWEQAKLALGYYVKGHRTHAWEPASRKWVPITQAPKNPVDPPGLSGRALDRIGKIQDAEKRGLVGHDAAEQEILKIIQEES